MERKKHGGNWNRERTEFTGISAECSGLFLNSDYDYYSNSDSESVSGRQKKRIKPQKELLYLTITLATTAAITAQIPHYCFYSFFSCATPYTYTMYGIVYLFEPCAI